eukprot:7197195-Prymnesium_polylepis.1
MHLVLALSPRDLATAAARASGRYTHWTLIIGLLGSLARVAAGRPCVCGRVCETHEYPSTTGVGPGPTRGAAAKLAPLAGSTRGRRLRDARRTARSCGTQSRASKGPETLGAEHCSYC